MMLNSHKNTYNTTLLTALTSSHFDFDTFYKLAENEILVAQNLAEQGI